MINQRIFFVFIALFILITTVISGCVMKPIIQNPTLNNSSNSSTVLMDHPANTTVADNTSLETRVTPAPVQDNSGTVRIFRDYPFSYSDRVPDSDVTDVKVLIIGPGYANVYDISVNPEGTYSLKMGRDETRKFSPGNYSMIVEYPNSGNYFSIKPQVENSDIWLIDNNGKLWAVLEGSSGFEYLNIVIHNIDPSLNGPVFSSVPIKVENLWLKFNHVESGRIGDTINISGATNYPTDIPYTMLISIDPHLTEMMISDIPEYKQVTIKMIAGDQGINTFSYAFNTTGFQSGSYYAAIASPASEHGEGTIIPFELFPVQ